MPLVTTLYKQIDNTYTNNNENRKEKAYDALERYMIFCGTKPRKRILKTFYNYFSHILKIKLPKEKRLLFLLRVASVVEANQHKQFELVDYKDSIMRGI